MKKYFFANWKNYLGVNESEQLSSMCLDIEYNKDSVEFCVFPNSFSMKSVIELISRSEIKIGSQNTSEYIKGAYTGMITIENLKELDIKYCLVGHSEQRVYLGETDEAINKKIIALIENNITPVLCVGENHDQRTDDKSEEIVKNQLDSCMKGISYEKVIIAYEPVWAISGFEGSKNATMKEIEEIHILIRSICNNEITPILYGGSVGEKTIPEYINSDLINGFLIGSASTKIGSLKSMLEKL
jgi:triosephosphate isomerase